LKNDLYEMFMMSNMVIMLLQRYLKQFAQEGHAKVPNEDVQLCLEQIAAIGAHLAKGDALLQEAPVSSSRALLNAWWWNSKTSTNSLQLPIKSDAGSQWDWEAGQHCYSCCRSDTMQ
jgi:hypothetical protein